MGLYACPGGPKGSTDFERDRLEALHAHAVGLAESDSARRCLTPGYNLD
ncbi:MAG TPA: hypothetical protein VKB12_21955 [Pyrinomonadaceae bacterium]|nr:hypothetical protein [Pyrinomonadaceae bacterium]